MNGRPIRDLLRAIVFAIVFAAGLAQAADPLPSWNDGAARQAIIDFVARTTTPGSPDFVPIPERIAVFDNDGTLWPENPLPFQLAFVIDELQRRVPDEPGLAEDPMVHAALAGDMEKLLAGKHHDGLLHVLARTHAGMTTGEFAAAVDRWLASARHPRFARPYDRLTYQPMLEVLAHLRTNGFKTFIVAGGGADFMRAFAERTTSSGTLVEALQEAPRRGWIVVDMKRDWKTVFSSR